LSRNASDVYSKLAGSVAVPSTTIESGDYNLQIDDIVNALNDVAMLSGSKPLTGLQTVSGVGTSALHQASVSQVQNSIVAHATVVGGTVDAIVLTFAPAFTANTANTFVRWTSAGVNTVTTPTVKLYSAGAALTIKKGAGAALAAGDTGASGYICYGVYNGTDFILLNPATLINILSTANNFTADQVISSTDAGAGIGPILNIFRDSASPAANDALGQILFNGKDSAGNNTTYGDIVVSIIDPTNGSEDGNLDLDTIVAGTNGARLRVRSGVFTPNATGGDMGADTINASAIYDDGKLLGKTTIKKAADQSVASTTLANDSDFTFALAANTKYVGEMVLDVTHTGSEGFKFDITGPASPNAVTINAFILENGSGIATNSAGSEPVDAFSTATTITINNAGNVVSSVCIKFYIDNGANAGTFQFRWANASTATSKAVKARSWMWYEIVR
jgi:hypothetical protein